MTEHGRVSRYRHDNCDECVAVERTRMRRRKVAKVLYPSDPSSFEHGANGYNYHQCRCAVCNDANNEAKRRYRKANA